MTRVKFWNIIVDESHSMEEARHIAEGFHKDQLDKGGMPYILHPYRVAASVSHLGEDEYITAMLHDVVEDCVPEGKTPHDLLSYISFTFGNRVRDAVDSVTRREGPPKEMYRDFVERSGDNYIGRIVKLADLADNMSPARLSTLPLEEQRVIHRYEKAAARLWELESIDPEPARVIRPVSNFTELVVMDVAIKSPGLVSG